MEFDDWVFDGVLLSIYRRKAAPRSSLRSIPAEQRVMLDPPPPAYTYKTARVHIPIYFKAVLRGLCIGIKATKCTVLDSLLLQLESVFFVPLTLRPQRTFYDKLKPSSWLLHENILNLVLTSSSIHLLISSLDGSPTI